MKFFFTGPVCPAGIALSLRQRQRYRLLIFLMRVSCTYIALMILSLQVLLANKGRGQNLDQIKVTIGMQNENLKTLFDQIELQTGLSFAFTPMDIEGAPTVSLPRATRSVKSTLDLALVGTYLRYEQVNQNVIVSKSELNVVKGSYVAFSIRGKITNPQGEGIPGVSVYVKGSTRGTTSDAEGVYIIDAEANDVLVFSSIGFKTQEVSIDARGVIDVGMTEDAKNLEEIVVGTGYWAVSERENTGNISKVTAKDLQKQPVTNPLAALQGRTPGVYVQQQSGVVGGNFQIRIRGQNSLRADGNDPLYVIDGVPFTSSPLSNNLTASEVYSAGTSPLNGININDIETIQILKDADATAIYGSRGANGVVLITTKKGHSGKTQIDVKFYQGMSQAARTANLLSTPQYLEMRDEAFTNDGTVPGATDYDVNGTWEKNRQTDWQKKLIGNTAKTMDGQISISGGEMNTQFMISTNYHRETVPFPGNNADNRLSAHLNLSNSSKSNKLKTNLSASYTSNFTNLIKRDLTTIALTLSPNSPKLYTENGELNWENSTWENPLSYLRTKYDALANTLIGNLTISCQLVKSLALKANMGYTSSRNKTTVLTPLSFYSPANQKIYKNSSTFSNTDFNNWIIEPQLEWKPRLNAGQLSVLLGTSFLDQNEERNIQDASGFTSESLMRNIAAATLVSSSNSFKQYRYTAIYSRINYTIRDRYIINITGRRDGSSRFGPGKQFANFGAIGAAWIFSEESFLQNFVPYISFGKLRASYGVTGNDQIGDYQYLDTYTPTKIYNGVVGLAPSRLSNANFAWETNNKLEAGIELGFIQDRIRIETSYFRNRSSNQLVGNPLPPTTGFISIQSNFPATVQNTGLEISINTVNISKNNFQWTSSFNITTIANKLVKFPHIETTEYADKLVVGEPINISKRYKYTGVDPSTGLYSVQDVNNDEQYDFNDQIISKFKGQKYFGGFQNAIQFKGFELSILLQFVKQTNDNYQSIYGAPGGMGNQNREVLKRWRQEGDQASTQLFSTTTDALNQYLLYSSSDAAIVDASFIRLKNISLSYAFTKGVLRIPKVKVFLQGQNILTITSYKGLDPEFGTGLPPLRVLTGGINATF